MKMNLEDFIVIGKSDSKRNTTYFYLYLEIKEIDVKMKQNFMLDIRR